MARKVEFDEELAVRRAMAVFWKKGYKGTTLRDLTDAMQINTSSMYNTLGDKHELFVRCVGVYTRDREDDRRRRAAAPGSPLALMTAYIDEGVTQIVTGIDSCMAVKATFEVGAEDARVRALLKADSDANYRFISGLIRAAMDQGEIAADEDPDLLTDYFISAYTGWHESYILHGDAEKIRRMARYFVKQLAR